MSPRQREIRQPVSVEEVEQAIAIDPVLPVAQLKTYPLHSGMSPEDFTERFNRIIWIKENLMKVQVHYGITPRTGDKPSLYQPGAQMLCISFQLAPSYEVKVRQVEDDFMFDTVCTLTHYPTGLTVGSGVGGGSTGEKRYHKKDPHDAYNMAAKMTAKRSYVAATISCTGVSEIFTQDLEDHPEFFQPESAPPKQDDLPGLPTREKMPAAPNHELRFEGVMANTKCVSEPSGDQWWASLGTRYFWTKDRMIGERVLDFEDIPVVLTAKQSVNNPNQYKLLDIQRLTP